MDLALFSEDGLFMALRWTHFFFGIAWIGHLYYFNFVQGAFFNEIEAPVKNVAFSKLVPRALWWFRYGALGTWLSGLAMLSIKGKDLGGNFLNTSYGIYITIGSLLGTLMFLNVWLIIWPNQKVMIANANTILGGGAANPEAPKSGAKALLASRHNVLFSIPLLFFMGASNHLGLNIPENFNPAVVLGVTSLIILGLELNAIKGKLGPLTTVKGVIHCGLGLMLSLYFVVEALV